jgi:hypothetical protein
MAVRHDPLTAFGGKLPEATNAEISAQFNKSVQDAATALLSGNPDAPKATGLFVLVGGCHWIPMVLRREGDKVSGYLIDSSWTSGLMRHSDVTKMVQDALGDNLAGFHYKYANMQGWSNACGLLTTRFICWVSQQLEIDPKVDIARAIDDYVAEWQEYTTDQQDAYVAGLRAEKLATVAENIYNSRFPPDQ